MLICIAIYTLGGHPITVQLFKRNRWRSCTSCNMRSTAGIPPWYLTLTSGRASLVLQLTRPIDNISLTTAMLDFCRASLSGVSKCGSTRFQATWDVEETTPRTR